MALNESPQEPLVDLEPRRARKAAPPELAGKSAAASDAAEPLSGLALLTEAAQAAIQAELDAADRQAASLLEEGRAEADSIRQRSEAQARDIMARAEREVQGLLQRGRSEAEAVELAARVRAREVRAQAEARLWGRLETIRPGIREAAQPAGRPEQRSTQPTAMGRYQSSFQSAPPSQSARPVQPAQPVQAMQSVQPTPPPPRAPEPRYSTGTPYSGGPVSAPAPRAPEPPPTREPVLAPEPAAAPEPLAVRQEGDRDVLPEAVPPPAERTTVTTQRPEIPRPAAPREGSFRIVPLAPAGDVLRYRVEGPFSMAEVLNLRQTASRLPGVIDVDVAPQGNDAVHLSLRSRDPDATVQGLRRLPGFVMDAEPARESESDDRGSGGGSVGGSPDRVGAFQAALEALRGGYSREAKSA